MESETKEEKWQNISHKENGISENILNNFMPLGEINNSYNISPWNPGLNQEEI